MTKMIGRLQRIQSHLQFKMWIRERRMLETMTVEELEAFALTGQWPERPEPTLGTSRLDSMDRSGLIKLWKEDLEMFAGRNGEELEFYAVHGHWPQKDCGGECLGSTSTAR